MKYILSLILISALSSCVVASEEDNLSFNSAQFSAEGTKQTGEIRVTAKLHHGTIRSLSFTAFGRVHALTDDQVKQVAGFAFESLQLSHEAGYERFGGHTVYLRFRRTVKGKDGKALLDLLTVSTAKARPEVQVTQRTWPAGKG